MMKKKNKENENFDGALGIAWTIVAFLIKFEIVGKLSSAVGDVLNGVPKMVKSWGKKK